MELVYKLRNGLLENGIWGNDKEDTDAAKVGSCSWETKDGGRKWMRRKEQNSAKRQRGQGSCVGRKSY